MRANVQHYFNELGLRFLSSVEEIPQRAKNESALPRAAYRSKKSEINTVSFAVDDFQSVAEMVSRPCSCTQSRRSIKNGARARLVCDVSSHFSEKMFSEGVVDQKLRKIRQSGS